MSLKMIKRVFVGKTSPRAVAKAAVPVLNGCHQMTKREFGNVILT
jgi:hypothetical protein